MNLYIKNMVCNRCILVVKQELEKLNLAFNSIVLGELQLKKEPTVKQLAQLKTNLASIGFEVLDDSKKQLIEKIKNIVVNQIHYQPVDEQRNFSEILSKKLNKGTGGSLPGWECAFAINERRYTNSKEITDELYDQY